MAAGPAVAERERSHALLSLRGIDKRFFGVQALRKVDFDVHEGEVHALVGENGAGKSTLIKIIAGAEQPDAGEIHIDGERVEITSTQQAFRLGVVTVYQEPQIFPDLSVVENVFLGRELRDRFGSVDMGAQRERVRELLSSLYLDPSLDGQRMGDLSLAEQQLVLICKALAQDARVIIYDEPSAILTQRETETLFGVIRQLRERGVATIYISHRLEEIFEIADRVTILKDGQVVAAQPRGELTVGRVVELMAGRKLHAAIPRKRPEGADVVLRVRGLTRDGKFEDVCFEVARGEIVGFFGLIGSGATDVAHALYGIEPPDNGTIELEGRPVRVGKPRDAVSHGLALLPKDRKTQGLFAPLSITYNICVGNYRLLSRLRVLVFAGRERAVAGRLMKALAVKAPSAATKVGALSGGNQQKVLLARQLVGRPKLIILDEPTRGVDVETKGEIHRLIFELADGGTAVVVLSSELPEVMKLADRVLVVRSGRIHSSYARGEAESAVVLRAAIGDNGAANGGSPDRGA
ncbi:ABC-type sugar transport system ATPase component [Gaiella occulta]|uniref:ABC-type sugar transport system ATPase component n=1 Tax=Gaiella occulta TaxID=1002870 RepID=A0A7M2Z283_9ACTN|nr:sugar ABC transporter ATP-binding protein [Gaiella occulta]RDI75813.1 ABC-type sugar transport system ATPase component [Gaiella occulta]